jgi:hypothetical protein
MIVPLIDIDIDQHISIECFLLALDLDLKQKN